MAAIKGARRGESGRAAAQVPRGPGTLRRLLAEELRELRGLREHEHEHQHEHQPAHTTCVHPGPWKRASARHPMQMYADVPDHVVPLAVPQ